MDIEKRVIKNGTEQESAKSYNKAWWKVEEKNCYSDIFAVVAEIKRRQQYRATGNIRNAKLYKNRHISGLQATNFSKSTAAENLRVNRITFNVVKSTIDTATAQVAESKTRPYFLTEKGNWAQQEKAKKLTQFMDGQMDYMGFYDKSPKVFRDCGIFGKGLMKIYSKDQKVECRRVLSNDIFVDDTEALYGDPRQLHHTEDVDKQMLIAMFPDRASEIMRASVMDAADSFSSVATDQCTILESWHLPSCHGADDGIRVISIDTATLVKVPYKRSYFPFATIDWSDPVVGWYGDGIADELTGIQLEINKTLRNIQLAIKNVAIPRTWVEMGSKVNTKHITNIVGSIVEYLGTKPAFESPQAMSPDVYAHLENLFRKAYEITGVSMMTATAEKPGGVNSAVGMRTLNDVASQRFSITKKAWDKFHLDAARMVIDEMKDIAEERKRDTKNGKATDPNAIKIETGDFIESIKWSDVYMPDDKYILRCFPTGFLPTQPGAKLEKVIELTEAGYYDREESMDLLDFPDLKAINRFKQSPRAIARKIVEGILFEGRYLSPQPFYPLDKCRAFALSAYLYGETEKAPEDRLEMLRNFIAECDALIEKATAEKAKAAAELIASQQNLDAQTQPPTPSEGEIPLGPESGLGLPDEFGEMGLSGVEPGGQELPEVF